MKKFLLAVALVATAPLALADTLIKPGLWEVRVVKQVMDGQDMTAQMAAAQAQMQEMMANMSPAQRKQMAQAMGQQAMPNMNAQRICISPAMAARDKPVMPADAKCEPAKVARSGNRMTFEINCTSEGQTMVGKGESMTSGDSVTTRMDMTVTDAGGRHTMQAESQMKFVGADCQGIVPADQLARELPATRKK